MAMLAEPRQRKRYNLVPRGKALYEDESRFGTKMLEKMGWSKGKGLGPKENGSQDFVRVRYKNDIQGLGFEQRDDQWTQHESSFSGLLKSLNGDKSEDEGNVARHSADSEDDVPRVGFGFQNDKKEQCTKKEKKAKLKENISGVSLEEKSKQSKARVHYKKFTKGKDLSQYSEKDLANIFGKKAVDDQEAAAADFYQLLNKNFNHNQEQEDKIIPENFGGVQTISTGLSVSDYFKMKMAGLKNRTAQSKLESAENQDHAEGSTLDEGLKKRKKRKRDTASECGNTVESSTEKLTDDQMNNSADVVVDIPRDEPQKKKKKRSKEHVIATVENEEVKMISDNGEETSNSHKKKKKSKEGYLHQSDSNDKNSLLNTNIECELNGFETTKDIKLKKNKRPDQKPSAEALSNETIIENNSKQKKKSKKQRADSNTKGDSTNNEDSKKIKRNAVSDPKETTGNAQDLNLQDLQANLNLFNVYRLSSFCAEKFRNLNLSYFPKSSLPQIEGYGLDKDLQLKIDTVKTDEMRITRLWDNTLSKYALMERETKKVYQKFVHETLKARKHKQKKPSLHFKSWKRKNAFAII